jgi:hypothetical protein
MGGTGKKRELPSKDVGKSSKSPPATVADDDVADDDVEDGDIATPKRDRQDDDDQPL